jgi:hypothetical protein
MLHAMCSMQPPQVAMPLILLGIVSKFQGLCNGTQIILERLGENLLKVKVPLPNGGFSVHLIPQLQLVPSDDLTPFQISRTQFPVRPAFA